jgi:all-trans-8'-apo-beta-carotenal 15,15'-oxygenase
VAAVPSIEDSEIAQHPPISKKWGGLFNSLRNEIPEQKGLLGMGQPIWEIEGTIPEDLNGDFIASGPVRFTILGAPVNSWFDGQGGMHRIRINGGKVAQWSRVVESDDYKAEEKAGVLEINHFNSDAKTSAPFSGARTFNTSNTQPMLWQDRLFSMYEGGLPVEMRNATLETIGDTTLDGLLHKDEHLSAHFHYHPRLDSIIDFSLMAAIHLDPRRMDIDTTAINLYRFPKEGKPTKLNSEALEAYPFLHDFILTDRYAVFLIPPVAIDLGRMMENIGTLADNYVWDNAGSAQLVLIDLDNPKTPIARLDLTDIIEDEGRFWQWHFANAYEDKKKKLIHVDFILYDDYEAGVKDFLLTVHKKQYPTSVQPSRLVRLTLSNAGPKKGKSPLGVEIETLANISSEFCRVSPRVLTQDYQYVYMAAHSSVYASYNCFWNTLCKVDVKNKTAQRYTLGKEQIPSEPIFVPRKGSEAEDDGYILCLTYDGIRDRSYLAIIDSSKLIVKDEALEKPSDPIDLPEGALLARLWTNGVIPITFHRIFTGIGGTWPVLNDGDTVPRKEKRKARKKRPGKRKK